ncbi:MAG: hypothetical protein EBS76_01370 [Actinobacteria bacterium]|nr:hypothetical protein [Actinomycetota bacterium]
MNYSVSIVAEGDREVTLDEVVELADAVAALNGVASGAGSFSYGAQIVIDAPNSDDAVDLAIPLFIDAARRAGLPEWPVTRAETISEIDELEELDP